MPYPSDHRSRVRAKIVDAARRVFNRRGFEAGSIEEIMAEAGMTRGGFYRYFASKSDLYAEVMDCFFTNPNWENRWDGVDLGDVTGPPGPLIVRAYLSRAHLREVEHACPMVALPGDVARGGEPARQAYAVALTAMANRLQVGGPDRPTALAIAALCIGGMVVARAADHVAIANEDSEAALAAALKLGGWDAAYPRAFTGAAPSA